MLIEFYATTPSVQNIRHAHIQFKIYFGTQSLYIPIFLYWSLYLFYQCFYIFSYIQIVIVTTLQGAEASYDQVEAHEFSITRQLYSYIKESIFAKLLYQSLSMRLSRFWTTHSSMSSSQRLNASGRGALRIHVVTEVVLLDCARPERLSVSSGGQGVYSPDDL